MKVGSPRWLRVIIASVIAAIAALAGVLGVTLAPTTSHDRGSLEVIASPTCERPVGTGIAVTSVSILDDGVVTAHEDSALADVVFSLHPGVYVALANGREKSVRVRAGRTDTVDLACAGHPTARARVFPVVSRRPTSICSTAAASAGVRVLGAFNVSAAQLVAPPYDGASTYLDHVARSTLFTECYVAGAGVAPTFGPGAGPPATRAIWVLYRSGTRFMVVAGPAVPSIAATGADPHEQPAATSLPGHRPSDASPGTAVPATVLTSSWSPR